VRSISISIASIVVPEMVKEAVILDCMCELEELEEECGSEGIRKGVIGGAPIPVERVYEEDGVEGA
jgi:hypothetical protein